MADVAQVIDAFMPQEKLQIITFSGDDERQAEVVACLPLPQAVELLRDMPMERIVALLSAMSGDDRADILGALDEEFAEKILAAMPDQESDEAAELMRYGESTAGGIMSLDFLSISEDVTAGEAIRIVQESPDVEMAFYIYVVSSHGLLVGVVSLRQLVTSKPDRPLHEIMNPHVVAVRTHEDQNVLLLEIPGKLFCGFRVRQGTDACGKTGHSAVYELDALFAKDAVGRRSKPEVVRQGLSVQRL